MAYNFIIDKENGKEYIPFSDTSDAIVLSETHNSSNQICSQTLEDGREYRDHVVNEPDSLSVELHIPNVSISNKTIYPISQIYKTLKELCRRRKLLKVTTFLEEYDNQIIQEVSTPITSPYKGMSTISVKFAPLLLIGADIAFIDRAAPIGKFEDPGQVSLEEGDIPIEPEMYVKWSVIMDLLKGLLKFLLEVLKLALISIVNTLVNAICWGLALSSSASNFNSFGNQLGVNGDDNDPDVSQKSNIGSFNTTVGDNMFSTSFSYDAGKGCYCISLFDVNGNNIASNIALLPGINCVKGLNIAIPSSDNKEYSSLYGIFVTVPYKNGKWDWDAASRPDAFTPDKRTKMPPCTLFMISDKEILNQYNELMDNMPHDYAYDFDALGYTVYRSIPR